MSNKNLTNEIVETLKLPELHVVFGGLPGKTPSDSFTPEADALVARRVNNLEKCYVADNNEWQYGKVYDAWTPDTTSSNYYVYNPSNRTVYLCTDNKPNNVITEDAGLSTVIPSHVEPEIQTYEDGYSWIPLFKVDISQLDFLSKTDLPLPNLSGVKNYQSFSERYESLCGTGVTAFGCCCLYFKENSVDEITQEVYYAGDVTNETIFSDCFECQKLAEALDRDVLFLSGITAGGITGSHLTENPLCPATKTIKTLQDELQEQSVDLVPGSSREYALYLLNDFQNNKGIMAARINLEAATNKIITTENQPIEILDVSGSGASINFTTVPYAYGQYEVTGVSLVASGSGYSQVTDLNADGTNLENLVKLYYFPEDFYTNPTSLIPAKRIRIKLNVTTDEISSVVSTSSITKFAVLVDPKLYNSGAPAIYPEGDNSFRTLQTYAFAVTGPTIIEA
jgi:hypothetical protein